MLPLSASTLATSRKPVRPSDIHTSRVRMRDPLPGRCCVLSYIPPWHAAMLCHARPCPALPCWASALSTLVVVHIPRSATRLRPFHARAGGLLIFTCRPLSDAFDDPDCWFSQHIKAFSHLTFCTLSFAHSHILGIQLVEQRSLGLLRPSCSSSQSFSYYGFQLAKQSLQQV